MSSDAGSNADGGAGATDRPSREVAYRLFATEFDDAAYSYSESDEERAPNYVVTPSGARVNRLFAVGVLTEVERVNDDVLRGRVVDPTGAFVSYAGQYQPDEMAFLDRASPPAFVALTGKARTFQPEDSDRVFTSVRPESLSRVDAETRDRWTVSAAEATLHRVGVMAAALRSGLEGSALRDALDAAGIDESLAAGVPIAVDQYGTTPAYLAALRRVAVDALAVVAGDRDGVRSLDLAPAERGDEDVDLGALAVDLGLGRAEPLGDETGEDESAADAAGPGPDVDAETGPETTAVTSNATSTPGADADAGAETETETATGSDAPATSPEPVATDEPEPTATDEPEPTATDEPEPTATDEPEPTATDETGSASTAPTEPPSTEPDGTATERTGGSNRPEPGDFDADDSGVDEGTTAASASSSETPTADELGDFETGETSETSETGGPDGADDAGGTGSTDAAGLDDVDADADAAEGDLYELDADEREQIEAEFGTEFSTGTEVDPAGEADIDVPSVDELGDEFDEDRGDESETAAASDGDADASTGTDVTSDADASTDPDVDTEGAAEVDLEDAAVEAMTELDDGDGAPREAVVAWVVEEYGVDPGDVEEAIQDALMSGQCYEPSEDSLKAI